MYPAAILMIATFLAATGALGQNSSVQCTEGLKMFVSRGTGEPMGLGATEALVDIIAEQINGSDIEAINFPATMEDPLYFTSVANGTILVKQTITSYAMACPGSKMAVFGYSQVRTRANLAAIIKADSMTQGAQITSNTLCGTPPIWGTFAVASGSIPDILAFAQPLPVNITKDVISVVLFGDPTHRSDASYNHGNSTGSGMFWRHDFSACEALGSRIRSYCDSGDPFCSVGPEANALTHVTYLDRYSTDVAQFVVDQYHNGSASNGSGINTPSPPTAPVTVSESGRHSAMPILVVTTALLVLGLI
ncbi:hypothetical protein Daus18300_001482 [Diaporthe australafricana]|uniref:Cutinase n=1 Tax=Diaporthe australafricana TaxID=127596 RepID=A0ABR3XVT6_9PEZI